MLDHGLTGGDASYNLAQTPPQSFVIEDVPMRTVHALAASGRWGALVKLPFLVGVGNGEVAVTITIQKNRTTVAQSARGFFGVVAGQRTGCRGGHRRRRPTPSYRFCVTLSDRAGREVAAQLWSHPTEVALLSSGEGRLLRTGPHRLSSHSLAVRATMDQDTGPVGGPALALTRLCYVPLQVALTFRCFRLSEIFLILRRF